MKRLFAVLLLANLGLAMWGAWYATSNDRQRHSRAPINAQQMRLLTEPNVHPLPRENGPSGLAPLQPSTAKLMCFSVGPFSAREAMRPVLAALQAPEWRARERDEPRTVANAYRVYLPPAPSVAAAEAKRRELTRLGVREHYLIQEHDKKNAISLGVFSTDEAAHRLADRLKRRGIAAQVETLYRTEHQYWIDAQASDATQFARLALSSAQLSQRACDADAVIPAARVDRQ